MPYKILDLRDGEFFVVWSIYSEAKVAVYHSREDADKAIHEAIDTRKVLSFSDKKSNKKWIREYFEIVETTDRVNTRSGEDDSFYLLY